MPRTHFWRCENFLVLFVHVQRFTICSNHCWMKLIIFFHIITCLYLLNSLQMWRKMTASPSLLPSSNCHAISSLTKKWSSLVKGVLRASHFPLSYAVFAPKVGRPKQTEITACSTDMKIVSSVLLDLVYSTVYQTNLRFILHKPKSTEYIVINLKFFHAQHRSYSEFSGGKSSNIHQKSTHVFFKY